MNEAKKIPVNPKQQREEQIKELLRDAAQRKRANKELDCLLRQFHGRKSILQLLPVVRRRCSDVALAVALERVERRLNGLPASDLVFLETFKQSLLQEQE